MPSNENPRTNLLRVLAVLSVLWLAGCGSKTSPPATRTAVPTRTLAPTSTPVPTRTPAPTPTFAEQIERAQQRWASLGITNYRIEFAFFENYTNMRESQREVTVKDGQVFDSSCPSDECPAFVLANVFTVYDLFAVAQGSRGLLRDFDLEERDECIQHLSFDPVYGFPNFISIDCPFMYDEDHSIRVVSFETIE